MNKAKAIFAAGMIVVVAGASAALWFLNDRGIIGNDATTNAYVDEYDNNLQNDNPVNENNDDAQEKETQNVNTDSVNNDELTVDESDVNDFLTNFAEVYFAEQGKAFDIKKADAYELILFAYTHIRVTDNSLISLEQRDDNIKYYNGVPYEKVDEILQKFFDTSVQKESVYTEQDHAFFSYEDGYFYTPAADGVGYVNNAVADSVEIKGEYALVKFTVYTDEQPYADGEAKIKITNNDMKLVYYNIY